MSKTRWWLVSPQEVLHELTTDQALGLSSKEAADRLNEVGANTIAETTTVSVVKLFVHQFWNGIILLLLVAVVIAWFIGAWVDAVVILTIVIINALIGFFQEYGAERSLAALRKLTKPHATVIRDGAEQTITTAALVPGDIVLLDVGDVVPADGRIIESHEIGIDEASLTGESVPVRKHTEALAENQYAVGDLANMAFMGTLVVKGRGILAVTDTGRRTKFGQVAQMIAETGERATTLQLQLKQMGYVLIGCSLIIAGLITLVGYLQGISLLELLFTSLSLFIAAVPEGLPAVITVALARGVKRMAQRHALIRRLASVETLGSISFICTDKTGTITQNKMVVTTIYAGGEYYTVTGTGIIPEGKFYKGKKQISLAGEGDLQRALEIGVLCNAAELEASAQGWVLDGDPTEGALLVVAGKAGILKDELEDQYPLIKENPFDSQRQSMSILRKLPQNSRLYIKGAGDVIVGKATHYLNKGQVLPLTEEVRQEFYQVNNQLAQQALRVIAVGYKDGPRESFKNDTSDEADLIFVGFQAMIDPPRPEVASAIRAAHHAGIRTIMLTGDHRETARAIAEEVGLIQNTNKVLTGAEVESLTDAELLKALYTVPVYARVSVEHKMRIVTLLTQAGEQVAMTGDGVNDAPALKKAAIGIAMGITGTDVAKEASDMVITDDNYASIVAAIEEGRGMYESLVKFVRYILATNLAELFVILFGTLMAFFGGGEGVPMVALVPVQLLWINLVTDGIPAIALVFDTLHKGLMRKSPHTFRESLVSPRQLKDLFGVGLVIALGVFAAYLYGLSYNQEIGQTMAFTSIVLLIFIQLFNVRYEFGLSLFSNLGVIIAVGISLILHLMLLYVPVLQVLFHTVPLSLTQWYVLGGIAILTWGTYFLLRRVFAESLRSFYQE